MSVREATTSATRAQALADLVESLTARLQAGERVDPDEIARAHPDHAAELRELLPALALLAEHSRSPFGAAVFDGVPLGELGDFRLIREIGRGGMGVVYEAMQSSLNRHVALKVLPFAATMDPRHLQRFRHEAQAAALLHHPNIVPVFAVGCERGVHYYAMQLIEGQSLAAMIDDMRGECDPQPAANASGPLPACGAVLSGPLPACGAVLSGPLPACGAGLGWGVRRGHDSQSLPVATPHPNPAPQAGRGQNGDTAPVAALSTQRPRKDKGHYRRLAELVAQAADALEYAHEQGVVHRDIKPANLLLDENGHLWVADFGLARLGDGTGVTASGDLLGTLRYMSPEQALAKHGMVDHRTDVYSLGATLYELLTLRPAVDCADKQTALRQIAFEEPTPPRKLDATIPPELETIALKALAKEPADRYPSAGEFAADLRRWLDHQTIRARRPSLRQRVDKWVRRHSGAVVAVVVALLVGTAVSTWLAVEARDAQRQAEADRDRAKAAQTEAEQAKWRAATESAVAIAIGEFLQQDLLQQADSYVQRTEFLPPERNLTVKEALDRAAEKIGKRFLDQPLVEAAIRRTIGQTYRSVGEYWPAVFHLERSVALYQANVGPHHADTILSMQILGDASRYVFQHARAITLYQEILVSRKAVLGADHPETLASVHQLAVAHEYAGQLDESVRLLEQLVEKCQALFGPKHSRTLDNMYRLAWNYALTDRLTKSLTLMRGVRELHRSAMIPVGVYANSWHIWSCQWAREFDQADRLLGELLEHHRSQQTSTTQQRGMAFGLASLALNLVLQGRPDEAESPAREAVGMNQTEEYQRFLSVSVLGAVLLGQRKYAEAEPFLLQGYSGLKQTEAVHPAVRRWRTQAGDWVVRLYEETGQPEKVRAWREKLLHAPHPEP